MSKVLGLLGAAVVGLLVVGLIISTEGHALLWLFGILVFAAIGSMTIKFFTS